MKPSIVIVDDDQSMCEMLADSLTRKGYNINWSLTVQKATEILHDHDVDIVLTDLNLPDMNGIQFCEKITSSRPDIPVIVLTAFGSLETAVAAIRAGAYDFVTKPVDLDLLIISIDRAVKHRQLQQKVKLLSEVIDRTQQFDELIGESSDMKNLFQMISRIADTDTSVLITGESGTGKELVAKALHRKSDRNQGPFIAINCSALPEQLLESELFGYKRGAFTDARSDRSGLFLQANNGTLFLDEIGEIPIILQPKLLRAIEERHVRPIGSNQEQPFNVRLISATNRDLETSVKNGNFREDLYYRLNVIKINVPPLRDRGGDILLLSHHFINLFSKRFHKNIKGIADNAAYKLIEYPWPGNVRELRNAIERAVAITRFDTVVVDDLPETVKSHQSHHIPYELLNQEEYLPVKEIEKRYILHVLNAVDFNKTNASRILGFDRKTLYRKMKEYNIQ